MAKSAALRELVVAFLARALRPFAGLCVRRGIKIQDAIEALKAAFVEAAKEELVHHETKATGSKIAVMTGLHRRDVTRLTSGEPVPREDPGLLAKIIGQWRYDARFSRSGRPRALDFEGDRSEFGALVSSVSKDLNAYTVLFELERLGAVRREKRRLVLEAETYTPSGDVEEGLRLLAEDTTDLAAAVEENIFTKRPMPNLHIKTEYDNVCEDALPEIRRWFLDRGAEFHEMARGFLSKFDKDLNPRLYDKKGGMRIMIGSFSRIAAAAGKKGRSQ